jgi:hypothetical protein
MALRNAVDRWHLAPASRKDVAFEAPFAMRRVEVGLASFMAIPFGLTLPLFASALARRNAFAHRIGWLGGILPWRHE